jgi:hypothetical protein
MSESETTETTSTTSSRKRSSSRSKARSSEGGKVVETYDDGLEAGYIGGPIDEDDHTVAGEVAAAETSREASD